RYQSAAAMKEELDNPATVRLTGRCDRLQEASFEKSQWKKVLWIALGISVPLIIFILLVLLIIHRGPAH
ncbi:MAG: hypothetical protein ACM32I_07055, partial [Nitrospirota bacterium]